MSNRKKEKKLEEKGGSYVMSKNFSSSSLFSLKDKDLNDRYNKRQIIYSNALEDIKCKLIDTLNKHCDEDVATKRSLEEYLLRELMIDYRNREGY